MLFNEPKLLKPSPRPPAGGTGGISVLFNEPKLLKLARCEHLGCKRQHFSALQRAEIAENMIAAAAPRRPRNFSALQRAEIAETPAVRPSHPLHRYFSALQRAEIAETDARAHARRTAVISVLFNEPKLLKTDLRSTPHPCSISQ